MTRFDAREIIDGMFAHYAARKVTVAILETYADSITSFPGPEATVAIARLVENHPRFPPSAPECAKAIRQECAAARVADGLLSPRLKQIALWQWDWNCPWMNGDVRQDARERLSDMVPPITQDEWDTAWQDTREKHDRHVAQCRKAGTPEPRPLPPLTETHPPPKSYAGHFSSPGEDAYLLPRVEAALRMRAILASLRQRVIAPVREPGVEG